MFNALELLFVVLALGGMAVGLSRRRRMISRKPAAAGRANWAALLAEVYGQKRLMARPLVGIAHLCLVWGFSLFTLMVILAQTPLRMSAPAAHAVSWLLDAAGLAMLGATLFFLVRRMVRNRLRKDPDPPKRTVPPLLLLLVILLTGFLAEGARLKLTGAQSHDAAPVGWYFSMLSPGTPLGMQLMIRTHVAGVILFILAIPFTFMRHLGGTSVHLLLRPRPPVPVPSPLRLDRGPLGAGTVMDLSALQLREAEACVGCGRCDEQCPARLSGKPLSPRAVMGAIAGQMAAHGYRPPPGDGPPALFHAVGADAVWACTTCMACVTHCPVHIRPLDKILELRRHQTLAVGALPAEAAPMIRNLELYGDVNGKGPAHRAGWALNRRVAHAAASSKPPETLLWAGCSGAFHPAYQQTTRDLVKLLRAAGVDFAILAREELCCGDPARKLGDEALFLKLARQNMARFRQYGIKQIVTCCPHCFTTLGREYAALGCDVAVVPAVSMVAELIRGNRIRLTYPLTQTLAIHDPCYLGRYHGIFEPIRNVCRSVPGVALKPVTRSKDRGFCCGGGGGRMWLHETRGENINVNRAREMAGAGVDGVVTACPFCLTMIADGVKTVDGETPPRVVDIISLAADALA